MFVFVFSLLIYIISFLFTFVLHLSQFFSYLVFRICFDYFHSEEFNHRHHYDQ